MWQKNYKMIKKVFKYKWIADSVPFFLFIALLAVMYIANGHYGDRTIRDITRTQKEIKELEYEYKTLKGEVMMRSREPEVVNAVTPLGLALDSIPPYRIK